MLCTFKKALFLIITTCSKLLREWSLMSSVWWNSKRNFERKGGVKNMSCIRYGYQIFNVEFRSKIQHYNTIVKTNKHMIMGNQCLRRGFSRHGAWRHAITLEYLYGYQSDHSLICEILFQSRRTNFHKCTCGRTI